MKFQFYRACKYKKKRMKTTKIWTLNILKIVCVQAELFKYSINYIKIYVFEQTFFIFSNHNNYSWNINVPSVLSNKQTPLIVFYIYWYFIHIFGYKFFIITFFFMIKSANDFIFRSLHSTSSFIFFVFFVKNSFVVSLDSLLLDKI